MAGCTNTAINGRSPLLIRKSTAVLKIPSKNSITGTKAKKPSTIKHTPTSPREKLLTIISIPGFTFPSNSLSTFFRIHAANGPMSIAPASMLISAPRITPIVANAPITPPRFLCTLYPPVYAISNGIRYFIVGATI